MLCIHGLYNIDRISIYVIKSHGQTLVPLRVETYKRCVPNLNEEYTGHKGVNMDLRVSGDSSDGRDNTSCYPGSQLTSHQTDRITIEVLENLSLTTETLLSPFESRTDLYMMTPL